jgi:integrase
MPRITLETVKNIQPGEIAWDSVVKGFGLRCRKGENGEAASKRYILKTRARGRQVWFKIGDIGAWTPEKARGDAQRILRELPVKDPETLRANPRGLMNIDALADRYLDEHVAQNNKPSSAKEFKRLLSQHIRPALGKLPVTDVTTRDVAKLHHKLRKTRRQANQALAVLSKMLSLAEVWHLRPLRSNPCERVQRFEEITRKTFLTDAQLAKLGETLAALEKAERRKGRIGPGTATAVRLLALTGCRLSEILNLRWVDVDLAEGVLHIRDAKAGGREHGIGAVTMALLEALERIGAYVCCDGNLKKPIAVSTMESAWRRIRNAAGLQGLRLHDLRHTYGTAAGQTGASAFMVRDALGHKTLAMTGRYVNADANPLKRLADQVSGRIGAALAGKEAEVEEAKPKARRARR